jgi:hypothetical protein
MLNDPSGETLLVAMDLEVDRSITVFGGSSEGLAGIGERDGAKSEFPASGPQAPILC